VGGREVGRWASSEGGAQPMGGTGLGWDPLGLNKFDSFQTDSTHSNLI
jgi:hypothetical protein